MASYNHESGPQKLAAAHEPVVNPDEDSSSTDRTLSESDSDGSRNPRSAANNCVRTPSKRFSFQRLWGQDDEIVILNGLMAYSVQKQSDPMQDLTAFHEFVKEELHANCTRSQLQLKIRNMRLKYEKNKGKEKDGEDMSFFKPRDKKVYELMKSVWESGAVGKRCKMGRPKGSGKGKGKAANYEGSASGVFESSGTGLEERVIKLCEEIFKGGKEWKNFNVEELEQHCKHLEEELAKSRFVLSVVKAAEL